ncbi:hypothetical protein [Ideonella dechloratans]|uniref:hypothetical protein n=1 Tax=Ideonella dechloratans TaxID=36863 RepID=UPI002873E7F1|nr:hypothetical protein [Ideonella dechloratans]
MSATQRIPTHASPRMCLETGVPPFAFEKCLQSGLSHTRPTGRFPVTSMGVIQRVHRKRLGVVVDGDVHGAPERGFQPGRGSAAAGEVVDDEFAGERQGELRALHLGGSFKNKGRSVAPLGCWN